MDERIAALATKQGGRISRRQLLGLGLSASAIERRRHSGSLITVGRGIYAVGHLHRCGDAAIWEALLACGSDAVLSHRSAAGILGMLTPPATVVHLCVPGARGRRRRHDGIRAHRVEIPDVERTRRDGLPITTMARTLLDLAATEPTRVVEQALDGADTQRILDVAAIEAIAPPGCGRPGAPHLWNVIRTHHPGTTITKSMKEEAMLEICRDHGLPRPTLNDHVEAWEVDFVWRAHRFAVEVQSTAFHATSQRIARDATKEADLLIAGWQVLHVADRQLVYEREQVGRRVAALLAQRPVVF